MYTVFRMLRICIIGFMLGCNGLQSFGEEIWPEGDINIEHTFLPISLSSTGQTIQNMRKIRMDGYVSGKTSVEIAANREPLVVTHTTASRWPALDWNLRNMSQTTWTTLYDVLSMPVPAPLCSKAAGDLSVSARASIFYMHDKGQSGTIRNSAPGKLSTVANIKIMSNNVNLSFRYHIIIQ